MAKDFETINPVKHGVFSTAGNVGGGIFGGGVMSMSKTVLWGLGIGAAVGSALLVTLAIGTFSTGGLLFAGTVGAVSGGGIGTLVGALVSPLTGLFGATKGGFEARDRVRMENGAARVMEAQMQLMRAQAMNPAVNDNKYNFAAQGSAMNPASTRIQADSALAIGTLQSQQLARA